MNDASKIDWYSIETPMKKAMVDVVDMASKAGKVCYLYLITPGKFRYGASFRYWDDWLFKAYPGGRKQLSIKGNELFEKESAHQ